MAIKLVQGGNSSTEKKTSNLKLTVSDASAFNKLASQTETSHVNMDAYKESKQESADSFYLNALKNNYINALSALEETKSPLGGSAYAPGVTLKQESEVQKAKSIYEQALERAESQKMEKYISEAKNSKSVNPLEVEDQSTYFKYINNIDQPVLPQSVKQYKPETYMTQDERDIFNYIYVNDGEDTAKKYVASIQDDLNQRSMPDIQKAADSLNPAVVAANAGLIRSVGGLQQVLREEAMPTNPFTVAAGNVREGLADTGPKILGQSLGQIGYDLIENTANMAPGIALGAATGGAGVAAVTLGASAAGNAYKEKLDEGYTPQQARVYSTLIGALEGGLQYAIGGIGAFGGTGNKIAQAVSGVKNAAARFALQYGGAMASEGLEEAAQEALEPVVATIALGKEFQPAEIENIAYAALLGGVSGGLFKGVEIASDVAGTSAVGSQVKKSGGVQSVIEEGLSNPADSTSYKGATALQDRLNKSGKLSNFAVGEQVKKNTDYRLTLGSANQTAQPTVNQQIAEQAEVSAPQQNVEQTGSQTTNLIDSAVAAFRENGSISNSQAVAIMQDADSMNILRSNGVELTDSMTMSQRRAAIKSGVESIAINQAVAKHTTPQQTSDPYALKLPDVKTTETVQADTNLPKVDTKGLVRDAELQAANISRTDADALDAVGKALGVGVKFVDQIGGGASNAAYSNGTIYIARDATDPLRTAFTHETVHRIKEAAPEAYSAMESFIKENINSDIMAAYRNVLESRGYTGTEADFTEETVADAFGYMLTDSEVLDQFVAKADKTVLQKIADTIREVIRKIKNILSGNSDVKLDPDNAAVFRDLLSKYEEMESVFYKAVRSVQETTVSDDADVETKFSLKTPVEQTKTLIALHNLTEEKLLKSIELGGFPMPSIAVTKTDIPHTNFGEISLVMSKETVDPKKNRKNYIFSADAWTPTFPQIEYEANKEVSKSIINRISELSKSVDEYFRSDLQKVSYDMDYLLNRYGGESGLIDYVSDNYGLKAAYLNEIGVDTTPETTTKEVPKGYNESRESIYKAIIELIGAKNSSDISSFPLKELNSKYGEELEKIMPGVTKTAIRLSGILRQTSAYLESSTSGTQYETVVDPVATREKIDNAIDESLYKSWVNKIYSGIEGESGVYNYKERFTPSGNLRTFKQTHYPVTLENIVKSMAAQNEGNLKNVSGFYGVKSLRAATSERFKSIADMHKAEGRLQNLTQEQQDKIVSELSERLYKIEQDIIGKSKESYDLYDAVGHILVEIADEGVYNIDKIMQKFNEEYNYSVNTGVAEKIRDLLFDVSQMPVNMFEAKPKRVVSLDEILTAVIPDNSSSTLKNALDDNSIPYVTYEFDNNSDRLQKVNSVDNAKFSLKSKGDTKEVAALSRQLAATKKKVEYWKGQTKLTKKVTTDSKSVLKAAKEIVNDADSDVDVNEIAADLQAMYDKMAGTDVIYDEIREGANRIADTIIENAVVTDRTLYNETKEMRSFIRSQVFYISEADKSNIADYSEWKKANKGIKVKVGTTNVDTIYSQLAEIYPEYFDESKISNPADQLQQIAYVYQATQEVVEYNPFDPDLQGAKVWLSNELIDRFFDLPQTAPTFADIAAKKLQEANARLKEAERSRKGELKKAEDDALLAGMIAQGRKDAAAMRASEDKYALRLQGTKQKYEKKLESTKQRYEAQMNLAKEYYQSQIDSVRKQRDKKIEDIKEKYASKDAARREARNARSLRDKITRHASKLSQKLLNPTDTQHVPEAMRNAVANLLNSINMESTFEYDANGKRIKKGEGDPTKKTQAFQQLRDQYEKIIKSGNEDGLVIDPNLLDMIANITQYSNTPISGMSSNQLQEIWDTIRAVEKSISEAGKMLSVSRFKRVSDLSEAIRRDISRMPEFTKLRLPGKIEGFLSVDMLSPVYFFKRMGKSAEVLYSILQDAQYKQIRIYQQAVKMRQELIEDANIRKLEREVKEFSLNDGSKIKLTTAQVMELYLLSRRDQANLHIYGAGIKPAEVNRGAKAIVESAVTKVDQEDVRKILSSLTADEMKIADNLTKIVDMLAEYGNDAYMEVYGYKKFREENYWPIKVDKEQTKSDPGKADDVIVVPSFGITKETSKTAKNALMVGSVFDTMSQHLVDMATFAAYIKPWHDVNRVHNFWFRDGNGNATGITMQNMVTQIMGYGGNKYWSKLLQDVSVGTKSSSDTIFSADGLTSAFKATAVGANLRVIIQQPTAALRAMAVMKPKYLISAAGKKNGWKKALKYSPIAQWKDWGYFEMNTGRSIKDILFDSESKFENVKQFSMAGAAAADKITWGHLWNAVEEEIADKGYKRGTKEFYEVVTKRFGEVIDTTQVVDSVLHRTQIMRSSNALHRMASSFMSEPSVSYNMATNAVWEARNAIREGDKKAAGKVLAISIFALSASNAVNAVAQSIIDGLRDDDKDKKYFDKFSQSFVENLVSAAIPLNYIPYLNSLVSIVNGYDVTRSDMELPSEIVQSMKNAAKSYQGTGKNTAGYASVELLLDVSRLFGIPLSNLKRDVQSVVMTSAIQTDNYAMQYILDKAMYKVGVEDNNTGFIDILYNAYLSGDESYEWIYEDMVSNGMDAETIQRGIESRLKEDAGVKDVTDLDKRYVAPSQEESYNDIRLKLPDVKGWDLLDADQKKDANDDVYQIVTESKTGLKIQEMIDAGERYGVTAAEYIVFDNVVSGIESAEDKTRQEQIIEYLDSSGMSEKKKYYLFRTQYKSDSNNPYSVSSSLIIPKEEDD